MTLVAIENGTAILRGYHYTSSDVLDSILAEGLKPGAYGMHAWGVGIYATLLKGCLVDAFESGSWRDTRLEVEARVPVDRLVIVDEDNAREMERKYLTWGRNDAYAVLVDLPDRYGNITIDVACQWQAPPECVRVLSYRVGRGDVIEIHQEG